MRYVPIVLRTVLLLALPASQSVCAAPRAAGMRISAVAPERSSDRGIAPPRDTLTDSLRFEVLETVVGFRRGFLGDSVRVDPCSLQRVAKIDSAKMASAFKTVQIAIAPWESCKPGPHHFRNASYVTIDSITQSHATILVWTVLTDGMYSRREKYELLAPPRGYPNIARIVQSIFSVADLGPPPPLRQQ